MREPQFLSYRQRGLVKDLLISLFPWLLFGLWFLLLASLLGLGLTAGQTPIDFQAYQAGAEAIWRGESPYLTPEASRQIWLKIHQLETDVLRRQAPAGPPTIAGPYVYPPTLALWLVRLGLPAFGFVLLLLLSVLGFGWLWLFNAQASGWWLLFIIASWDVLATFSGGNVELLLLFLTLLAAHLLWRQAGLWAAPLITLVVLIKPFYSLFFAAFGGLMVVCNPDQHRQTLLRLLVPAGFTLGLIGLEIWSWGPFLWQETRRYLQQTLEHHWFVLPVEQQTPLSIWNRTALQGLVNAGLPAEVAQVLSLSLWLAALGLTSWRCWGQPVTFPRCFALALVLLYWGRPVGWGLVYLEVVVLVSLWPVIRPGWSRNLLLGAALLLLGSHWLALILTAQGYWLRLLTLQSAEFPWETWLLLPGCWLLLLGTKFGKTYRGRG